MPNTAQATKVITGPVRLSYAHLFEAFTNLQNAEPKFSVMLLIPKSDTETISKLRAAEKAAAENGRSGKFDGKIPKDLKSIIKDGDEADLDDYPERAGHLYMTVSASTRPGVVDQQLNQIIDSSEIYSGCYARVSINAFPYNVNGNRGVSFGLNHVMKWEDGEFLGGRSRAEDDFADLAGLL